MATSSRASAGRTASARARSGPRRLDLAWHSTETNEVGLHEFASWLDKVDSELMLAVNLGTRGTLEALDLLEYSNIAGGTALIDQRRIENGRTDAFGVKMWCLGNEMDGPWQLGHRSADDYGKLASQTAKAMRQLDPSLELVVCGSSSAHMPTFGEWERVGARRTPTRTSTTSRATPTTRRRTATSAASSPPPSTWTTSSSPSSRRPTT